MVYAVAGNPDNLERVIKSVSTSFARLSKQVQKDPGADCRPCDLLQRSYVVYPPEGPRPPTADEMAEIMKKQKDNRK